MSRGVLVLLALSALVVLPAGATTARQGAAYDSADHEGQPMSAMQATPTPQSAHPIAIIHTTAGDLRCELFPDKAPITVANFTGSPPGTRIGPTLRPARWCTTGRCTTASSSTG